MPNIGLAPEDYFRVPGTDDNGLAADMSNAIDKFVAPSIMKGKSRYDSMLKRDSDTYIWKIALKTDRKAKLMYEERLPAGFPLLHEFFTKSKSMRVFQIGLDTYRALYPETVKWTVWHSTVENIGQWNVQALRNVILTAFDPALNEGKKLSRLQLSILRLTVDKGMWPSKLAASLPKRLRLEIRWGLVRWVCRVRKYAKAWAGQAWAGQVWAENHVSMSPSLKRKWSE